MVVTIFKPSRRDVRRQDTTFALQQDNWNDYNFQTLYHLYYRRNDDPETVELIGPVKILKQGQTKADEIQLQADFERLGPEFCSVGISLDYYRHLKEIPELHRTEILDALRDVVAHPELQSQFNAEPGWATSLFRDIDPAEFLADASAVFRDNYSELAELSSNLSFHAAGWADPLKLDFQAPEPELYAGAYRHVGPSRKDVLLPRRLIVLIGRNGAGKSTLLSRIARVAYASPSDYVRSETASIGKFDPPSVGFMKIVAISYSAFDSFVVPGLFEDELSRLASDVEAGGGRYVFAGLRDIAAEARDVVKASEQTPSTDPGNPQRIASERRTTTYLKTLDQIADEFARLIEQIKTDEGDPLFACALAPILADPSFADVADGSPDSLLGDDPKTAFLSWSTGHKIVLHVVASLVAHTVRRSLVLYDEPETHLHPPLIAALMKAIRIILEERNAFAVVATHSPVVIQETLARHVRVVRRIGDSFHIITPDHETFGENAGALTYDVFGLSASVADYQEVLDLLIAQLATVDEVEQLFTGGISAQARAYVMAGFAAKKSRT